MIEFFSDKEQLFECTVKVLGNKFKNIIPRLIFKDDKNNKKIIFEGDYSDKICKVKISPFSDLIEGEVNLEVLVDDTRFTPWKDKYVFSKSIMIENIEVKSKKDHEIIDNKVLKENISDKDKKMIMKYLKQYMGSKNKLLKENINSYKPSVKSLKWCENVFKDVNSLSAKISVYFHDKDNKKTPIKKNSSKKKILEKADKISENYLKNYKYHIKELLKEDK